MAAHVFFFLSSFFLPLSARAGSPLPFPVSFSLLSLSLSFSLSCMQRLDITRLLGTVG